MQDQISTSKSKSDVPYGSDGVVASADTWLDHRSLRIGHCDLSMLQSASAPRNEQRKYSCQQK